jgi:hypothetical protein
VVASSQLLGANSQLALRASPVVAEAIASMTTSGPDNPSVKMQVVGNPEVEKDTFKILNEGIKKLNTGTYKDNDKAREEIKNTVDNILQQFGDAATKRGIDAKTLQPAIDFFSSPEFGVYAKSGNFDIEALDAAKKTLDVSYQRTVIDVVDKAVQRVVTTNTGLKPNRAATGEKLAPTTAQFDTSKVVPTFNGTGITFKFGTPATTPQEVAMERQVMNELKQASQAITKLIHIGAHMEGSTEYGKFWEANKHILLPRFFSAPEAPKESPAPVKRNKAEDKMAAEASNINYTPDNTEEGKRRTEQDVLAIKSELSRKGLSPTARRILEDELKKLSN